MKIDINNLSALRDDLMLIVERCFKLSKTGTAVLTFEQGFRGLGKLSSQVLNILRKTNGILEVTEVGYTIWLTLDPTYCKALEPDEDGKFTDHHYNVRLSPKQNG